MADASIAPVLIQANVARYLNKGPFLNRYLCPACNKEKLATTGSAKKSPLCRECGTRKACGDHHGLSLHPLYKIWEAARARCTRKSDKAYRYYGLRGISMCEEWARNPKAFIDWSLANGWEKGLQIDRVDVNGNYEPSNCRFVSQQINCQNRRRQKLTPELVRAIRMLCWSGLPQNLTAKILGLTVWNVNAVMKMKSWSNV